MGNTQNSTRTYYRENAMREWVAAVGHCGGLLGRAALVGLECSATNAVQFIEVHRSLVRSLGGGNGCILVDTMLSIQPLGCARLRIRSKTNALGILCQ